MCSSWWRGLAEPGDPLARTRTPAVRPAARPQLGDGGDSPAWSRKRDDYEPLHLPRVASGDAVRRTARALVVQLPRRRVRPGGTGRGGRPARPRVADADRPRRRLRRRPVRRGGRGVSGWRPASAPSCPSTSRCRAPRRNGRRAARVGVPDPPGTHLLALARDPERLRAAVPSDRHGTTARRRQGPSGLRRSTSSPPPRTATGWCSPAAARVRCGRHWSTAASARRRRALDELVARFGRDNVAVELTHELDPLADERYEVLAALADDCGCRPRRHDRRALPRHPRAARWPPRLAAVRARSIAGRDRRLAAGLGRAAPAQRRRDGGAVRALARRGRQRRPAGQGDRVPAAADRAGPAAVPRARPGTTR